MPLSNEISLILVLIVTILSFFIGLLLGKASPTWLIAGIAIGTFAIVVRCVLLKNPHIEYRLFEGDWYSMVRPWWGYPIGMFLTGAAIPLVKRFSVRVLSKAAAVILFFVSVRAVVGALAMDYTDLKANFPDPETGMVKQMTAYSCGAAASAMLLNHYGIYVSEGEMAEICMTNSVAATDEFSVRRGLRQKLEGSGKEVFLENTDFDTLRFNREGPMMAVVKYQHLLDHWVVIRSISENGDFEVLDPRGEYLVYKPTQFRDIWKNTILYIK